MCYTVPFKDLNSATSYRHGIRAESVFASHCCGSCRSVTFGTDPDPAIFFLQDYKKKLFFSKFFCLLLFEGKFSDPDPYLVQTDPYPGGPKTYGSGSTTLVLS